MSQVRFDLSRYLTNSIAAQYSSYLAEKVGLRFTRTVNSLSAKRMEVLIGLGIDVVIDIGANAGQWASEVRASGYSGRIISFEPGPGPFAKLQAMACRDPEHDCIQAGLGSRDGDAQLLMTRETVSSSFRNPVQPRNSAKGTQVEERLNVPIRCLDSILPSLTTASDRFYMKIDVQGFEKEVLNGGADTLLRTDAVEVELSLVELYEGQALLPEVWQMLVGAGLRPAWLERGYRDSEDIWLLQADGLFVREGSWHAKAQSLVE